MKIAEIPMSGARLCSACRLRLTCRYVGKGKDRHPVCGPCQGRASKHLVPKMAGAR